MFTERLNVEQITYPLDDQPMWLNDPRNTEFSEQRHHGHHDRQSCAEYIKGCSMFWGIQEVDSGDWIGTLAAHIDEDNEVANLGILIHVEYAGNGYGTEAWNRVCEHLLNGRMVRKIEAGCMANNKAMRRICEKSGMVVDGERKSHFLYKGRPVNLVYYAKWPFTQGGVSNETSRNLP